MPGQVLALTTERAVGWAAHPRLPGYNVVVNLIHRSLVVRSALADRALAGDVTGSKPTRHGFAIDVARLGISEAELGELCLKVGETDETLQVPDAVPMTERAVLTVEDILALAQGPRPWVTGETYLDAAAAGLRTETIVDLLYRDYLGRGSDPNGLAHYTTGINSGRLTFDSMRHDFLDSDEFRLRRTYADRAPGSTFSQKLVIAAANMDRQAAILAPPLPAIDAAELVAFDGEAFVTEMYRRLLRKEPDGGGMAHYLHLLGLGSSKFDIIRHVAGELEAISLGVRVTGLDPLPKTEMHRAENLDIA